MFFYKVTDNPTVVSANEIWLSDGLTGTRGMHDPAEYQAMQWCLAVGGTQNVQVVNTLPYAVHARLVALNAAPAPAPANVSIDVAALASALAQHLALVGK